MVVRACGPRPRTLDISRVLEDCPDRYVEDGITPDDCKIGAGERRAAARSGGISVTPSPGYQAVTRFAPSPTGYMHMGHAYAALCVYNWARLTGGRFLLRIEDIDRTRCRREYEDAILDDLEWLGLHWDGPVLRQSERLDHYTDALARLKALGVTYPCFCTRKEIAAEIAAAGNAPHGPDGPLYPGTCRDLGPGAEGREGAAIRFDCARAARIVGRLTFKDWRLGDFDVDPCLFGDAVVARRDIGTSYHLACVVDDAAQGVTMVTRGEDLLPSTHLQRVLQALLGLPRLEYRHHGLVKDENGRRLAKRNGVATIRDLRAQGMHPEDVLALARARAEGAGSGLSMEGFSPWARHRPPQT
ncbi:MAG: tRNA glutamyl-Q(34) synthetase GluQRS [Alphaproteobacteria bacterium]|nr:tRNA glutamyl-Q(34) synthetase GluQRS [Alphaproteobacteria bacterium]